MKKDGKVCLMEQNISGGYDFSKLEEVAEGSAESKLFKLIDDIDTAFDMFKPTMGGFEKYILRKIKKAHDVIVSDGYKLYFNKQ